MAYDYSFASVYDIFTDSVGYEQRAEYILKFMNSYGITEGTVLDVACGTGSLAKCFLEKGFEVVANDISVNMLNIAREKLSGYGDRVLLLCQDMCELDLFGTVDAAVCSLDSINHLLYEEDIIDAFSGVGMFIRPSGLFIFDVNTLYKHRNVLSDKTFVYEDDKSFLVWQNSECDNDGSVEMYIDIFTENENGSYSRQSDTIVERAYSVDFLAASLEECGFEIKGIFSDMTSDAPKDSDERLYFVAMKK